MEVTEVRIKLILPPDERLLAFCSITFDHCFVVRDVKIIGGPSGLFVAMPSRKLCSHCSHCGFKNQLRAAYCNQCGQRQPPHTSMADQRLKLYADIAHPINTECRDAIQSRVVAAYHAEVEKSRLPGYSSLYEEDLDVLATRDHHAPPGRTRRDESHTPHNLHAPAKESMPRLDATAMDAER